jgi:hypothetical protein
MNFLKKLLASLLLKSAVKDWLELYSKGLKHTMPKHEIFHKAGEPVSSEVRYIIDKYFNEKEIKKLERLGGRILLSVSAPYKKKNKEIIAIDQGFIDKLKSNQDKTDELKKMLDRLTVKQLKKLCTALDQPVRSSAVAEEIKRELIRNLQSEEYWQRISKAAHNEINSADAESSVAD